MLAIALSRAAPDYTDDERDLLDRIRPLLISGFRAAIEHTELRRTLAEPRRPHRGQALRARLPQARRALALGGGDARVGTHAHRGVGRVPAAAANGIGLDRQAMLS